MHASAPNVTRARSASMVGDWARGAPGGACMSSDARRSRAPSRESIPCPHRALGGTERGARLGRDPERALFAPRAPRSTRAEHSGSVARGALRPRVQSGSAVRFRPRVQGSAREAVSEPTRLDRAARAGRTCRAVRGSVREPGRSPSQEPEPEATPIEHVSVRVTSLPELKMVGLGETVLNPCPGLGYDRFDA